MHYRRIRFRGCFRLWGLLSTPAFFVIASAPSNQYARVLYRTVPYRIVSFCAIKNGAKKAVPFPSAPVEEMLASASHRAVKIEGGSGRNQNFGRHCRVCLITEFVVVRHYTIDLRHQKDGSSGNIVWFHGNNNFSTPDDDDVCIHTRTFFLHAINFFEYAISLCSRAENCVPD
mmetsp:Transcript_16/g.37  ORF Transcript_16/g.37 Transcript_16/m.37 type:complete len:173 (-) Transcript_16:1055-1573(-)